MEFPSALNPFRSLQAVWRAVQASPGAIAGWWAIGLAGAVGVYGAFYLVVIVFTLGGRVAADAIEQPAAKVVLGGTFLVLGSCLALLMLVLQCYWRIGLENVLADTLRTGQSRLADAFRPRGRLWAVIGAHVLVALVLLLAYVPLGIALVALDAIHLGAGWMQLLSVPFLLAWAVGFAYVALGLSLAPFAAALEPLGPVEALGRAWRATRGKRLALLVFWSATVVFALAGFLLFCVGYLATVALVYLMPAEAWLALTRADERQGWWITTGMPPA